MHEKLEEKERQGRLEREEKERQERLKREQTERQKRLKEKEATGKAGRNETTRKVRERENRIAA